MKVVNIVFFIIVFSVIIFLSCPAPEPEKEKTTTTTTTIYHYPDIVYKSFYSSDLTNNSFYSISAGNMFTGSKCIIYVEDKYVRNTVTDTIAQNIANEFDNNIYTKITGKFGSEPDVDGNGKVIILIQDIRDEYAGSGGYVAGYFYSYHEYATGASTPNSNQADVFFMDCYPAVPGSSSFYGTLAHEFQHMINFNQKVFQQHSTNQDTWINEGLSSAAETVYSGTVNQPRVNYYNADRYTLISQGVYFLSWSNDLENYATVYMFFQWLRMQQADYADTALFSNIIQNANSNYLAVVNTVGLGTWDNLLGNWFIANYFNSPSGIYGYKGFISSITTHDNTDSSPFLYPGEGLYRTLSSDFTPSSTPVNAVYIGVNKNTESVDISSPYSGQKLICFNSKGTPPTVSSDYFTPPLPVLITPEFNYINPSIIDYYNNLSYPIDVVIGQDGLSIPKSNIKSSKFKSLK